MNEWNKQPPQPSDLGDHDVPLDGDELTGRSVALLVTGGIAAYTTPTLVRSLRRRGAKVKVFCSSESLRYVGEEALAWASVDSVVTSLGPNAEHLSDSSPFGVYLVAPASYNTIGKVANGIADTVVTATLASALGRMERGDVKILMAPTMHGSMHNSVLVENCTRLSALGVRIIPPRDAYGKHNLPREDVLVDEVIHCVRSSAS